MRVGYGLLTALLLLVGGTPVQAQKSGAVEIGAFGRFTKFESKLNFDNRLGLGGRLGVFVLPNLALEGDVTYTRTKSQGNLELRHTPVHARLIYNIPAAENAAVLVGAGYVRNIFRANYRETRSGSVGCWAFDSAWGTCSPRASMPRGTISLPPRATSCRPRLPGYSTRSPISTWASRLACRSCSAPVGMVTATGTA